MFEIDKYTRLRTLLLPPAAAPPLLLRRSRCGLGKFYYFIIYYYCYYEFESCVWCRFASNARLCRHMQARARVRTQRTSAECVATAKINSHSQPSLRDTRFQIVVFFFFVFMRFI